MSVDRDQTLRHHIGNTVAYALTMTMTVSGGYLVGYLHATSMPENAEPGFMLGFTLTAALAVPTIYILTNGVPEPVRAFLPEVAEGDSE